MTPILSSRRPIQMPRLLPILTVLALFEANLHSQAVPQQLPIARVGEQYRHTPAVDGLTPPLTFRWEGKLPPGLKFVGDRVEGSPTAALPSGTTLTLAVEDALGVSLKTQFLLVVRPPIDPLEITSRSLPVFVVGEPVDYELAARGGEGPLTWKATPAELPPGLQLDTSPNSRRCRLHGVPRAAGPVRFSVSVADGANGGDGPLTLEGRVGPGIAKPLVLARGAPPPARVGQDYFLAFQAQGGVPPYRWRIHQNALDSKSHFEFDGAAGVLRGVPSSISERRVSVVVADSLNMEAAWSNIVIRCEPPPGPPLAFAATNLPNAIVGEPYEAQLVVLHARGSIAWSHKNLPDWLKATSAGPVLRLAGNPPAAGVSGFQVAAEDLMPAEGPRGSENRSLSSLPSQPLAITTVAPRRPPPPPKLATSILPDAYTGRAYDVHLASSGGEPPVTFEISNPPPWLKASPAGRLQGTPPTSDDASFEVVVKDAAGNQTEPTRLRVRVLTLVPPGFKAPESVQSYGMVGKPFSLAIPVVGGLEPYTWDTLDPLPPGLSLDPANRLISGVPETPGNTLCSYSIQSADPRQPPQTVQVHFTVIGNPDTARLWSIAIAAGVSLLAAGATFFAMRRGPKAAG